MFEDEAALLERRGHEVVRYTLQNDELQSYNAAELARITHWNPRTFRDLSDLIEETKPDVAHFHNTFPLMSASVYDACQRAGVPVAQTLHNYRLLCPAATLFRDGRICEDCLHLSVKLPAVRHSCYRGRLESERRCNVDARLPSLSGYLVEGKPVRRRERLRAGEVHRCRDVARAGHCQTQRCGGCRAGTGRRLGRNLCAVRGTPGAGKGGGYAARGVDEFGSAATPKSRR